MSEHNLYGGDELRTEREAILNRISLLNIQMEAAQSQLTDVNRRLHEAKKAREAAKAEKRKVAAEKHFGLMTFHAFARMLERAYGVTPRALEEQWLGEHARLIPNMGAAKIRREGVTFVVKDGRVVTVLTDD